MWGLKCFFTFSSLSLSLPSCFLTFRSTSCLQFLQPKLTSLLGSFPQACYCLLSTLTQNLVAVSFSLTKRDLQQQQIAARMMMECFLYPQMPVEQKQNMLLCPPVKIHIFEKCFLFNLLLSKLGYSVTLVELFLQKLKLFKK